MQSLSGLSKSSFLTKGKIPLVKFEVYHDASWINLCNLGGVNYLVKDSWSVNLGGAKLLPTPVAGEWSAEINNPNGIFHPGHPDSSYSDLFEEGKKIRISLGSPRESYRDDFDDASISGDWTQNKTDANRTITEASDVLTVEIAEGHSGALSSSGGAGYNRSPKCYMAIDFKNNPPYDIITKITDFTTNDDGDNMGGLIIGVSPHLCYGKFRNGKIEPTTGETLSYSAGDVGILRGFEKVGGEWDDNDAYGYLWFESTAGPARWKNNTWMDGTDSGNDFLIAETDVTHDANCMFGICEYGAGRNLRVKDDSSGFDIVGDGTIPVWLKIQVDEDWNITFWYSTDGEDYTQYEDSGSPFVVPAGDLFGWNVNNPNLKVGLFAKNNDSGKGATSVSFEYFEATEEGDGLNHYWQRIIGCMEEPIYQGRTYTVQIGGYDYMKLLMDTELRKPDNYWGTTATESTIASEETFGAEIYDEGDAMEIDTEANNVTNWSTVSDASIVSVADAGGGTTWVGRVIKVSDGSAVTGYAEDNDVGSVEQGKTYKVVFKYARAITGTMTIGIYKTGTTELMGEITGLSSASWVEDFFYFEATETCAIRMRITVKGASRVGTSFKIDVISIKQVTGIYNANYPLPAACTGVYYVTLDGSPIYYRDEGKGWWYDSVTNALYIENERELKAGTNNLIIYYFTAQTLENVVADLLVTADLYDDQAAALAGMNYTATGISVDKVFFEAGNSCLEAIRLCCERANYRFFFKYDGTPDFNPAPTAEEAGSEDISLHEGTYSSPRYYRNKSELWNRVIIEGLKQGQLIAPEEAMEGELRGEENDATSIATYGEHTKVIKNHLFQDQTELDAMCVTLLALRKDPNYYFDSTLDYNPLPLELGDTAKLQLLLAMGTGKKYNTFIYNDGTLYGGNGVVIIKRGLIRDISISGHDVQYKCEEVT